MRRLAIWISAVVLTVVLATSALHASDDTILVSPHISASHSCGVVTVTWSAVPGASSYEVFMWESTHWEKITGSGHNSTSVSHNIPNQGGSYYYIAIALGSGDRESGWSNYIQVDTPAQLGASCSDGSGGGGGCPTATPYPTYTPYPTPTPYPTYTPYPTPTPHTGGINQPPALPGQDDNSPVPSPPGSNPPPGNVPPPTDPGPTAVAPPDA